MPNERSKHIADFFTKVESANREATKKEAFKDLLNRLFADNEDTRAIIDAISSGAEAAIINIPRKGRIHRGSADTLYNKVIIEFENDLRRSLSHAKEQLAGYLLGQFNSGEGYNYTLVATDCIHWKVFSPDITSIENLESLSEETVVLEEVKSASFTLDDYNSDDFFYWIDRFLFKEQKQKATLKRIEESFGYQSTVFIQSFRELSLNFRAVKESGEVQVSFEQWKRFLSIAYGSFVPTEQNFLIHTYLSIFAKMLAYAVVSADDYIEEDEVREVLDGTIFERYNIVNFVENDFFHWVATTSSFNVLKGAFRLVAQELATFDFIDTDEDVLKGVYQEMIDLDTRHALGEYYTPDWLCQKIVEELDLKVSDKVLDPACGSGSFLRAIIDRSRALNPEITIEQLNDQVHGIDIHPLSVQIAKTTLLVALGRDVIEAKTPIHLNIILANALLEPQGVEDLYGREFLMQIDKTKYPLDIRIFDDMNLFDQALNISETLAIETKGKKKETLKAFTNILKIQTRLMDIDELIAQSFYKIYEGLKHVKECGRDSIWKFIVQNLYKPYFLSEKFDYVVGNPPWFTYSSIRNEDYQTILNELATELDVKPERKANFPHLEIAAIFLAYCSSYFLRPEGHIAFVLPRSFFSADHHDNTRSGKAKGFALTEAWDLNDVSPLFRIPSCVLFARRSNTQNPVSSQGLKGKSFRGQLPANNCTYELAAPKLTETEVTWFYVKQGRSSAFSTRLSSIENKPNPYKIEFKQGATIVPRAFYFVDVNQELPSDFNDRFINVRTAVTAQRDAKKPWTGIELKGRIESRFLFFTALSKSILPFALYDPSLVVLPITLERDHLGHRELKLHSVHQLRTAGFLNAATWFRKAETFWIDRRTEKNQSISSIQYLNWQNKLVEQNLDYPYLVLYNSSAQDANATVLKRSDLDLEFIIDHKEYAYATHELDEAYYLTAILNSSTPNQMMKDFQSRGLFGARDIHKKILDVYFPRFVRSNLAHLKLAKLSADSHEKTTEFLATQPPSDLTPARLGRLRTQIRQHLRSELESMDKIVADLMQ